MDKIVISTDGGAAQTPPQPEGADATPGTGGAAAQPSQPTFEETFQAKAGFSFDKLPEMQRELEALKQRQVPEDDIVPDSDFLKDLVRYAKRTGKIDPYLEAKGVNFDSMSDEEVLKRDIRRKNPMDGATPEFAERFVEKELDRLRSSLGFSEYDEPDDIRYADEALRLRAAQVRQELKAEQAKFVMPERAQQQVPDEARLRKEWDDFNGLPEVRRLVAEKKVVVGDFNYAVNPEEAVRAALDYSSFAQYFQTKDGRFDTEKFFDVFAFVKDPAAYRQALLSHEVAKARLAWLREVKNPSSDPAPAIGQPSVVFKN